MTEDEIFYQAWATGLDVGTAHFLSDWLGNWLSGAEDHLVTYSIRVMVLGKRNHRTRNQMKRYLIRNRRAYHHDQALIARHIRETLRVRDGMRCHCCRTVPPQPGEVMDPDCMEYIATLT